MKKKSADVCLVLEATYPYVYGGVASWTHDLIQRQKDLSFHIVTIVSPSMPCVIRYEIPPNVLSLQTIVLQELPKGKRMFFKKSFFSQLEKSLLSILKEANLEDFALIVNLFKRYKNKLGANNLLNSKKAWKILIKLYKETIPDEPFLDFFWSYRFLLGSLFSILLADVPLAKIYHSICTGYAGLFSSKASIETKRPCCITEHGIYTNERRIEIISSQWLHERDLYSLNIEHPFEGIKNFWTHSFSSFSKIAYQQSQPIITLFEGNQELQYEDGASKEKMKIIPNGIETGKFINIKRKQSSRPFKAAFIGRIVPIKDVKTFIRSASLVYRELNECAFLILGPWDEDPYYYKECKEIISKLGLEEKIPFLGKVPLEKFLGEIDLLVLTSVSEAQPLVILECGAAGIPVVSSDVGSCRELILGKSDENPLIGPGGIVTPLLSPEESAKAIIKIFKDKEFYQSCSKNIRERINRYYNIHDVSKSYHQLYQQLIKKD